MTERLTNTHIVFMGTPAFAATILKTLHDSGLCIDAVYAQPDRPKGRGQKMAAPPVAIYAKEHNLPLYQPERVNDETVLKHIEALKPDFLIVAAYGKMLPERLLSIPQKESLNVHASLLPKYRGAAPINYALLHGEEKTGVAIMRVVKQMDAGPVFLSKELTITPEDTSVTLTHKLAYLGSQAIIEAIEAIKNNNLTPTNQEAHLVTFAPKMSRDLSPIDWTKPSLEIFNQIRALLPWPTATTSLNQLPLKIYASKVINIDKQGSPGKMIHIGKNGLTIQTGQGELLITEVQIQGKKRMSAFDLANGLRLKADSVILGT
ncbi:MAG: methionyl-tRNA formyltransferase [bacterium]|nr:methionyl-tRNA formyltransferase [bacterium]MBU1916941.1 methionyl-tRNA formyltransferase [bacterium]